MPPAQEKRFQSLIQQIPRTELDAIARDKAYRHLDGDPEALKLAWFAREVENTPSPEAMRPLARQMWDFLSDVVGKLFVKAGLRDARTPGFNADLKDYIFLARDAALKNGGQTPQSIATSSASGRTGRALLPTLLPGDAMPADTASRITSIWKPHRPDPDTYLHTDVIQKHLEQFKAKHRNAAVKVIKWEDYKQFGPKHADESSYVLPISKLQEALAYANGDRRKLETALGYDPGALGDKDIGIVTFTSPDDLKLQMPTGNETGANPLWIPGGKLPKTPAFDGLPEAVLDLKGWHKHHWPYQSLSLP